MTLTGITAAFCLDSSIVGRADYSSMNDQTHMELLISEMKAQSEFKDGNGDLKDIDEWQGIELDEARRVSRINFESELNMCLFDYNDRDPNTAYIPIGGTIDLQWMPNLLLDFVVADLYLEGTIDTHLIPRSLKTLDITGNKFTGRFCMEFLPQGIQSVNVNHNMFHGSLNVSVNLEFLDTLSVRDNKFSGTLDMSSLPKKLQYLDLTKNLFAGKINLVEVRNVVKTILADTYLHI